MTAEPAGIHGCRVLVVEDAEPIRRLIGALLAAVGIADVAFAEDGVAAMDRMADFAPDLVILDIMMPRMDGFEVCRRLRADSRWARLPILVQTALGSPEERTAIFRAGATDVIAKPIHGPELIARLRVHLENRLLLTSLQDFQDRLNSDLQLARRMQEDLLPSPEVLGLLGRGSGLRIHSHFQPSSEIGGDFWGIEDLGNGRIAVCSVDLTGHGITAALNAFRMHTLMRQLRPGNEGPAGHVAELNRRLADLLPAGQFATLFYGIIDTSTDSLTYASAGAPNPILAVGNALVVQDGSGLPVGITADVAYEDRRAAFPPGASLFLYSDAFLETPDDDGHYLDEAEVVSLLGIARRQADPLGFLVAAFTRSRPSPQDDLTMVWISRSA